jgi:hypothetical protein
VYTRPSLPALSLVLLLGVVAVVGCSPNPPSVGAAGVSATVAPTAIGTATAGDVHLSAYTDNDGPTATVILTGAVGDYGQAHSVNPDGSVNAEHSSQLDLALSKGSFRLDLADVARRFVAVAGAVGVNTATCSSTASVTGDVAVVAGSGTGAYVGITGTFHLTITLDEVYRPIACSVTGAYLAQSIVITGPGTVTYGT